MKKLLLLLTTASLLTISCSKECKMCTFQELDNQGNILTESDASEICEDELERAENFEGVSIDGTARYECK